MASAGDAHPIEPVMGAPLWAQGLHICASGTPVTYGHWSLFMGAVMKLAIINMIIIVVLMVIVIIRIVIIIITLIIITIIVIMAPGLRQGSRYEYHSSPRPISLLRLSLLRLSLLRLFVLRFADSHFQEIPYGHENSSP